VKQPPAGPGNRCGGQKKLPLLLPLDNQQAVEADVVNEDAVRQVAARPRSAADLNSPGEVMPNRLDLGLDGLAGTNLQA